MRNNGKQSISQVLSNTKTSTAIEKAIYDKTKDNEEDYREYVYQTIGDIILGKHPNQILENIKTDKIGWKHSIYGNVIQKRKEQDNFIVNPFEIVEGVLECKKCGSKRVWSCAKQTRSGDESISTIAECADCKSRWMNS